VALRQLVNKSGVEEQKANRVEDFILYEAGIWYLNG
jgi:hypothetical protein